MDWTSPNGRKIILKEGDITRIAVDAMANAANTALAGGGGVDGAIHRAGGPSIMLDLSAFDGCPTGSASRPTITINGTAIGVIRPVST